MTALDLDALLAPVSEALPAGEDLSGSDDYMLLAAQAQPKPERIARVLGPDKEQYEHVIPGEPADHAVVLPAALALFARSKDLRIAMYLLGAATRRHGLQGYADTTELIARLCSTLWKEVHPQLDPEDDDDPTMRINILAGYNDPQTGLQALRGAQLAEARAVGRYTLGDIDVAAGNAPPPEGRSAATRELLLAACAGADPEQIQASCAHARAALASLAAIEAAFTAQARRRDRPDLGQAAALLRQAVALYEECGAAGAVPQDGGAQEAGGRAAPEPEPGAAAPAASGQGISGRLGSRADAARLLTEICDYLERVEPAHPTPLLVRRAVRLLDMSFMEIMRELSPEAVSELERLGGVKRD